MVSSKKYWRDRELEHIQQQIRDDEVLARRLRQKYMDAMNEIQKEIEAFYGRYASREGISMEEARKRASKLDIEKYAKKAKRYVKERNFSDIANEQMRIYNLTMRVNRLELLKLNIELELLSLVSAEERFLYEELTKASRAEYERLSGILGETINYNAEQLKSVVNNSFLNATWSDRLWSDQVALRAELDKLLHRGIVQGLNPRELARDLRKVFNTSTYNSERLLRTELARVQIEVQKDSYNQTGFKQYEYIAEPTACDDCAELDGKIFDVDKMTIAVNAPILHPNCRCSTSAYMSRAEWDADLKARGL